MIGIELINLNFIIFLIFIYSFLLILLVLLLINLVVLESKHAIYDQTLESFLRFINLLLKIFFVCLGNI